MLENRDLDALVEGTMKAYGRIDAVAGVLDRQLDEIGVDSGAETADHFPLDRVGLAADPRREVSPPTMIERGHLGEPRDVALGRPPRPPTPSRITDGESRRVP